ncbi:MAG: M1 family metallopeptidase [Clostridia bacterium]|nr:M1 family metallopeptidase [Clostridia bacterium]
MKRVVLLFLSLCLLCGGLFALSACGKEEARNKYTITAEYDPNAGMVTAHQVFDYVNTTQNEISVLEFNLFPNAYREGATYEPVSSVYRASAYYDGESYGGMEIQSVAGCERFEVGGEDKNILYVYLTESVFPDERAQIEIDFTVTLAKINHRTGITEKVINLGNFYPILCVYEEGKGYYECIYYSDGDPFYSECADYDVTITVPVGYTVAASGYAKGVQKDGKMKYRHTMSASRDFALAIGNDLKSEEKTVDGKTVRYVYYADTDPQGTLNTACAALTYFSDTFGEYGYDSYTLVQTGFCYGGMEYPGMVLLSDALERQDYLYTVVHETAHQWWYAMVGNNQLEYAWMDEGAAEYATILFYENHAEYGLTREKLVNDALTRYKAYYGIYEQIFGESDTRMSRPLSSFLSEYEYANVTYNKGVLLFDALREGIGDSRFFAGFKNYFSEYRYKIALPSDMVACFRKTGVDVDGLFDSFTAGETVI